MASVNKCLSGFLNLYKNCFWIYEDEYSDDLLNKKLDIFERTKKQEVEELLNSNVLKIETKHDTSNNKLFLKNNLLSINMIKIII